MASRRFHHKSRAGCEQCKKSRRKCDEGRPNCDKCLKRSAICSFSHEDSSLIIIRDLAVRSDRSSSTLSKSMKNELAIYEPAKSFPAYILTADERYNLRLMHHYTISTCYRATDTPESLSLWQTVVPELAQSFDFLMSIILATTSLHLAITEPSDQHGTAALRHHTTAIAQFRPHLTSITPSNVSALFAFSCLVPFYSFGMHSVAPSSLGPLFELNEIFNLLRGIAIIVKKGAHWLENGFFACSLLLRTCNPDHQLSSDAENALIKLSHCNDYRAATEGVRDMFSTVIQLLRETLILAEEHPGSKRTMLLFPIMVASEFIVKLNERDPLALAILAHYGVVLFWLREDIWLQSWGCEIVEAVSSSLDAEWNGYIEWPLKVVQKGSA